jgi:hypothetical protein
MSKLYLLDSENITFQPATADEAIILFGRLRRKNLIHWDHVHETFQQLAKNLDAPNHDRFCDWICNPCGVKPGKPGYFADLCKQDRSPTPIRTGALRQASEEDEKEALPELSHPKLERHNSQCGTST